MLLSLVCTSKGSEVIGTLGRSITFYLQRLEGEAAAWSFHNDVIVTVKFGDPPEATFFDDNYKPRLAFPNNGSALTISQLRMEDAGTYTAKSSGVKTTFTLHIYRELSVPTVTCMVQNCSASICRYILHCTTSGSSSGNVSYIWSMGSLRKHGATMLVEESLLDEPLLTCTVQNPVSSSNITIISLTALCAGNSHGKIRCPSESPALGWEQQINLRNGKAEPRMGCRWECGSTFDFPEGFFPPQKPPMRSPEGKGTSVGKVVAVEGLGPEYPCHCSVAALPAKPLVFMQRVTSFPCRTILPWNKGPCEAGRGSAGC
uniref:Ig-like domain-containing protein n=1 Tax=Strigops habroptila TaxID=2489341 RepID=A0A672UIE6_STRHB